VHPDPVEWSDAYFRRLASAVPEIEGRIDRLRYQRGYRRLAAANGIPFVDMLDRFPDIPVSRFRFSLDPHANVDGHRVIASQLLKGFDALGLWHESAAVP